MTDAVAVLGRDDLGESTGTPGLERWVAFEAPGYWCGHVVAEPEMLSGWHHHGQTVTMGYVLSGELWLEFGPGGRERVTVGPGSYFTVPAGMVHREGNASADPAEIVLVRVGDGPPVSPVDGPEPI